MGTFIVGACVLIIAGLAGYSVYKNKKNGAACSGCKGCNSGCCAESSSDDTP